MIKAEKRNNVLNEDKNKLLMIKWLRTLKKNYQTRKNKVCLLSTLLLRLLCTYFVRVRKCGHNVIVCH